MLQGYALQIEKLQAPGADLSTITAFASKSAEQAARIAGVLALFKDLGVTEVSRRHMASGIELVQYYLSEARRLADAAIIPVGIQRAETLRIWLLERWSEPVVSIRAVARLGPNELRNSKIANAAVEVLVPNDWLVDLPDGAIVVGTKFRLASRIVGKR